MDLAIEERRVEMLETLSTRQLGLASKAVGTAASLVLRALFRYCSCLVFSAFFSYTSVIWEPSYSTSALSSWLRCYLIFFSRFAAVLSFRDYL